MQVNNKTNIVITVYRIPATSSEGLIISIAQYNRINAKRRSNNKYRKKILDDIVNYLKHKDFDNLIILADWNKDILSDDI